jgi:hypothetical protein
MAEKTLVQALVKAQSEMGHAVFDQVNPQFKSRFASLKSVIDAAKPALNANGIAFIQRSIPMENGISVETVLYGYGEEIPTGPVPVPAQKITAQGYGSAMTYAKRYSLAMAVGIAADEDDDGEAAEVEKPQSAPKNTKPKPIQHEGGVEDYSTEIGAKAFLKGWIEEVLPIHDDLTGVFANNRGQLTTIKEHQPEIYEKIKQAYNRRKAEIEAAKENNDAEL